jgi:hypothetical protein
MKELVKYLRDTRLNLESYHSEENCDMFMEEVLEVAINNWMDENNGEPNLTEPQWNDVRNIFLDKKYNRITLL